MPTTVKPASPEDSDARRRGLLLAFIDKVFEQLKKGGIAPVKLAGALGPRSEIVQGLKFPDEPIEKTQKRIIAEFAARYPLLASSAAVDATV